MKIGILTSGILPVPAVKGGAVENLIDFFLEYNNEHHLHDITIYSIHHPQVKDHPALQSRFNHYCYIDTNSYVAKLRKRIYLYLNGKHEYYHYTVEYFLAQAMKQIRKQQFDIIIIENRPGFVLKLKQITQAKLVIHQENDYLNNQVRQYREIYDATSCIINTSAYITRRVQTINPSDKKCKTLLNGIDIKRFINAEPRQRATEHLNDTDFVIIFSGRLTKEKGIAELIQAIAQLKSIPNIKLLIIGASFYGTDKNKSAFIQELETKVQPIYNKVVFTGYIDYQMVPSYLKMADIAVVPSMWEEAFGLTVVEAMAAGLPLITTRSGGIPEICDGVATIVDRENIVDNLATAILDIYEHPEKRKQMAAASLERSKLFDKETYAQNYFAALENIE